MTSQFPYLAGISGFAKGNAYKAYVLFGRDADCDIGFPEASGASRRHAEIRFGEGKTFIRDLNSTNGTYVNGARMARSSERELHHRDIIRIDDCRFVFLERAESAAKTKAAAADEAERIRRAATIRAISVEEVVAAAPKEVAVALLGLGSKLNSLRSSSEMLRCAKEAVLDMIRIHRVAVVLVGHSPDVFRVEDYLDLNTGSSERFEMNRAIRRQALRDQIPVISPDGDCILCVPLMTVDEAPLGFIYIQHDDPEAFNAATQMLLTGIADVVAPALRSALEREWFQAEYERMQRESAQNLAGRTMIGNGPKMRELQQKIAQVATTDATVLITGESGTGKEVAARVLHDNSNRRGGPFVAVNMAAIPEDLKESELFGHEKGSFTHALSQQIGKFELANHGTLFLDEIGDASPKLQVTLLRVIQEREIQRVGGSRPIPIDIRLIAATNRNLEQMVREGSFRQDLYFRLKVIQFRMPSLGERPEDIVDLANYFIHTTAARMKRPVVGLAFGAEQVLLKHEWTGNVRELQNTIEAAIAYARSERITVTDLREILRESSPVTQKAGDTYASFIERAQRHILEWALTETKGDVYAAADILEVNASWVYKMLKTLGMSAKDS